MTKPGFVDGRHYTTYVGDFRSLKREGRLDEAAALLLRLVDATEAEAKAEGWGVAPAYYEQLAIVCRKMKRPVDELAILERYERQPKAPGAKPEKLAARLTELRRAMKAPPSP